MRQTRLWIEIVVIVAVAVTAFVIGRVSIGPAAHPSPSPTPNPEAVGANGPVPPQANTTRVEVPSGVTVPDKGAAASDNVAVPDAVAPAGPDTTILKRSFNLKVENDKLSPDTIIVRQNDIVNITVSAIDKDYDFVQPDYGMGFVAPKGEPKTVQNQFTQTGKFTLYCSSCGGPAAGPRGYIIVVAPNGS